MLVELDNERQKLRSATALPNASSFLWNRRMMIHMNCRGYASAQFMQPEPAKYAHAPGLEAKTFMQPEQTYYAHHAGRFFYIKDESSQQIFSVPYEPVRKKPDHFVFSAGKSDINWEVEQDGLKVQIYLSLAKNEVLELWRIKVINTSAEERKLSLYTYFPVGYMSWMNQSGKYLPSLNGIVCSSISPYQKYQDYAWIRELKDKTFLISDVEPSAWEVSQVAFEGDGGLHFPSGTQKIQLDNGDAIYETPACVMQYRLSLEVGQDQQWRFLFGPAKEEEEIREIRRRYFIDRNSGGEDGYERAIKEFEQYVKSGFGSIRIGTPDHYFDHFVNHWLPRQVFYHGETNRLCTDPQTRNFLQDMMGMCYIKPGQAREAFYLALSQQRKNGAMPDGILVQKNAELKYINQVPHTDHCVWLPICLQAYLDETGDYQFLNEEIPYIDGESGTVFDHLNRAMYWLADNRDYRGLSFIDQGDWCDPMNMVGPKGVGVSGWLTMATSYALQIWSDISQLHDMTDSVASFRSLAMEMNNAINLHLWDGAWYARGITDDNVTFGISSDTEGSIYLNTQGWALLCGCADQAKIELILQSVERHLETPYGLEMLAPPYMAMREDVGRVTQKHPGSAENGSVYNHAVAFYIYALYSIGEREMAFRLLRKMLPGPDDEDLIQRGQMPVYIPNYYRGAFKQYPRTAGRSSQLFNTGTVHWVYRILINELLGLKGDREGLNINPKLPGQWDRVFVTRYFRQSEFEVEFKRVDNLVKVEVFLDGEILDLPCIKEIEAGKIYKVLVNLPHK